MCKSKYEIDENEAALTEGEDNDSPFGGGAGGDARMRSAMGGLDTDSEGTGPVGANSSRAVPVSCKDIPANAPDSFKVSRYLTVGSLSTGAALPHAVPATTRKGLSRQEVICNMRYLATNCLDPLYDWGKANGYKFVISSGFRNETGISDHNIGSAADLIVLKNGNRIQGRELTVICKKIDTEMKLPFTQMIHEFNRLLHIACRKTGNSGTRIAWSVGNGRTDFHAGYRYNV